MSLARSAVASSSSNPSRLIEFDILKAKHKFLREDDDEQADQSWEDKLAQKYYSSLYREYAVCDLKHYKSGNFALRWRTEEEVISGAGESSCGNTRCVLHSPRNIDPHDPRPPLKTLELPFAYIEEGETKSALVKVVLCDKCCRKLMWKREKEKERLQESLQSRSGYSEGVPDKIDTSSTPRTGSESRHHQRRESRDRPDRSRSPRREKHPGRRPRSP